ncbi:hypothetical protein ANTPLA_LOCUS7604 [Anthophora plagiata]
MRWYLCESATVATSCGYPGDITSKRATSRNLNESKTLKYHLVAISRRSLQLAAATLYLRLTKLRSEIVARGNIRNSLVREASRYSGN